MTERTLQTLRQRANHRGLVVAHETTLAEEVQSSVNEFRSALERLEEASLIEVLSLPPFLVLRVRTWRSRQSKALDSAGNAYSYPKQLLNNTAMKADSYSLGASAVADDLLQEILQTLGETDPRSFRMAIEHYSPHVIRTALKRVLRAKSIRKNRTALFRHLLPRIAKADRETR